MNVLPSRPTAFAWLACICVSISACSPEIGDDCGSSLDCSAQSSRECDRTQRGGYCTITPCERGTCPDEATCVKFRPTKERLAVTFCMRKCSDDGDCRDGEGYRCTTARDFSLCNESETLDSPTQRFCASAAPISSTDVGAQDAATATTLGASAGAQAAPMPSSDAGVQSGTTCMETPES